MLEKARQPGINELSFDEMQYRITTINEAKALLVEELKNIYYGLSQEAALEFDNFMSPLVSTGVSYICSPEHLNYMGEKIAENEIVRSTLLQLSSVLHLKIGGWLSTGPTGSSHTCMIREWLMGTLVDVAETSGLQSKASCVLSESFRASMTVDSESIPRIFEADPFLLVVPLMLYTGAWMYFYVSIRLAVVSDEHLSVVAKLAT